MTDDYQMYGDMKRIWIYIVLCWAAVACSPEEDVFTETPVGLGSVKLIKLRADHCMMLPDGKATMKFYAEAYNILELPSYAPETDGDSIMYNPKTVRDTSLIPAGLLPEGLFRLVDNEGREYPDFAFSTTDTRPRTLRFHLEAGELVSDELEIRVRELPEVDYEPIEVPVIFHLLNYVGKPGYPEITITSETVRKNIERLNDVFNGKSTTDPNGGNARITFRAAEYDNTGMSLEVPGLHVYEMPSDSTFTLDDRYRNFVFGRKTTLMYDFRNFLNIWLIYNPNGAHYVASVPNVIDDPENPIPGLTTTAMPSVYPNSATDIGFFVNVSSFLNPDRSSDAFEISTAMARYLGCLPTLVSTLNGGNMVNGDTDFCPDTPYYYYDNLSVFKTDSTMLFTSYNVMDAYSYKNSVTVDQAARIRRCLERCPSRWMWKSRFAFTGRKEDRK